MYLWMEELEIEDIGEPRCRAKIEWGHMQKSPLE
jgi:hypothetical protein